MNTILGLALCLAGYGPEVRLRTSLISALLAFSGLCFSHTPAKAAEQCGIPTPMGMGCEVGVHTDNFLPVAKQMTPVTCWAASFVNLLRYANLQLSETDIVGQTTGSIRAADGSILDRMLNRRWADDTGRPFVVSARATDRMTGTVEQITNADIYQSLKEGVPVYFTDQTHAMIVLQAIFVNTPAGPLPVAGVVAEPDPAASDYRPLNPQEMIGMYAAIVSVRVGP
jgi:hypothetical protein